MLHSCMIERIGIVDPAQVDRQNSRDERVRSQVEHLPFPFTFFAALREEQGIVNGCTVVNDEYAWHRSSGMHALVSECADGGTIVGE